MTKEVAAITGGSSGIGKGFVERFSRDGYQVVFCGRNEAVGEAVAREHNAEFIKCDVSNPNEVEDFFRKIKEKYKRLDVLTNNAAILQNVGRMDEISVNDYLKLMDINSNGAWYVLKYAVSFMVEMGNGGRIVNMSSVCGSRGYAWKSGVAHYSVSKHAINGLTQIMALEYAKDKIRVNAIAPGGIQTEMIDKFLEAAEKAGTLEETEARLKAANPMLGANDPLPKVSDVTGVAAFLCGPDAKFINGAIIPVDGGETCK